MERRGHDIALAHGHDAAVVQLRQDIDVVADALDDRRPDEDGVDRTVAEHGHCELRLEAFELSPEGVALDRDVEQREDGRVAVGDLLRQQDHAGAGAEDRRALARQVEDRLAQPPAVDELAHRGALAAGQDQPAEPLEVLGQANGDRLDAELPEDRDVLGERALDGENADPARGCAGPR